MKTLRQRRMQRRRREKLRSSVDPFLWIPYVYNKGNVQIRNSSPPVYEPVCHDTLELVDWWIDLPMEEAVLLYQE